MSLPPEIIAGARRGDRDAVEALTRAFLPRVYGLCLRLSRRRELAEEATQETFVRALRGLPDLRDQTRLAPWMLAIAANTTRELARRHERARPLEREPIARSEAEDPRVARRLEALDAAVQSLPDEDRRLFVRHTVDGVRLKQLAGELSISLPAIKSKLHRIRTKVRASALDHLKQLGGHA